MVGYRAHYRTIIFALRFFCVAVFFCGAVFFASMLFLRHSCLCAAWIFLLALWGISLGEVGVGRWSKSEDLLDQGALNYFCIADFFPLQLFCVTVFCVAVVLHCSFFVLFVCIANLLRCSSSCVAVVFALQFFLRCCFFFALQFFGHCSFSVRCL